MTVPALELADIFRIHGPAYLDTYGASLSAAQIAVAKAGPNEHRFGCHP